MSSLEDLKDLRECLISILEDTAEGMTASALNSQYFEWVGSTIPYFDFKYENLIDFMKAMPGVNERTLDNGKVVYVVANDDHRNDDVDAQFQNEISSKNFETSNQLDSSKQPNKSNDLTVKNLSTSNTNDQLKQHDQLNRPTVKGSTTFQQFDHSRRRDQSKNDQFLDSPYAHEIDYSHANNQYARNLSTLSSAGGQCNLRSTENMPRQQHFYKQTANMPLHPSFVIRQDNDAPLFSGSQCTQNVNSNDASQSLNSNVYDTPNLKLKSSVNSNTFTSLDKYLARLIDSNPPGTIGNQDFQSTEKQLPNVQFQSELYNDHNINNLNNNHYSVDHDNKSLLCCNNTQAPDSDIVLDRLLRIMNDYPEGLSLSTACKIYMDRYQGFCNETLLNDVVKEFNHKLEIRSRQNKNFLFVIQCNPRFSQEKCELVNFKPIDNVDSRTSIAKNYAHNCSIKSSNNLPCNSVSNASLPRSANNAKITSMSEEICNTENNSKQPLLVNPTVHNYTSSTNQEISDLYKSTTSSSHVSNVSNTYRPSSPKNIVTSGTSSSSKLHLDTTTFTKSNASKQNDIYVDDSSIFPKNAMPETGQSIEVTIEAFNGLDDITLRRTNPLNLRLTLDNALNTFYNEANLTPAGVQSRKINFRQLLKQYGGLQGMPSELPCVVNRHGCWKRALMYDYRNVAIQSKDDSDSDANNENKSVSVRLVDWGIDEHVALRDVRRFERQFANTPVISFLAYMPGLVAKTPTSSKRFDGNIKKIAKGMKIIAKVIDPPDDKCTKCSSSARVPVQIRLQSDTILMDLAAHMIERNLISRCVCITLPRKCLPNTHVESKPTAPTTQKDDQHFLEKSGSTQTTASRLFDKSGSVSTSQQNTLPVRPNLNASQPTALNAHECQRQVNERPISNKTTAIGLFGKPNESVSNSSSLSTVVHIGKDSNAVNPALSTPYKNDEQLREHLNLKQTTAFALFGKSNSVSNSASLNIVEHISQDSNATKPILSKTYKNEESQNQHLNQTSASAFGLFGKSNNALTQSPFGHVTLNSNSPEPTTSRTYKKGESLNEHSNSTRTAASGLFGKSNNVSNALSPSPFGHVTLNSNLPGPTTSTTYKKGESLNQHSNSTRTAASGLFGKSNNVSNLSPRTFAHVGQNPNTTKPTTYKNEQPLAANINPPRATAFGLFGKSNSSSNSSSQGPLFNFGHNSNAMKPQTASIFGHSNQDDSKSLMRRGLDNAQHMPKCPLSPVPTNESKQYLISPQIKIAQSIKPEMDSQYESNSSSTDSDCDNCDDVAELFAIGMRKFHNRR